MPNIVTFDTVNLEIIEIPVFAGSPEVMQDNELKMQEIYSEWKEFIAGQGSPMGGLGFPPAVREVGGDPTSDVQNLGVTYFMINGWRLKPAEGNHRWVIDGNVFTDPSGQSVFAFTDGNFQVNAELKFSNLIDGLNVIGTNVATTLPLVEDIHGQVQREVFVNTENVINGVAGYQQAPFNNFTDAVDYAEANNLLKLVVEADATVDRQLKNFEIQGIGLPTIDVGGEIMDGTILREVTATGTQGDSNTQMFLLTCAVANLLEFNGSMLTVTLVGTLSFRDGASVLLNNVVVGIAGFPGVFDMQANSPSVGTTVGIQNASGSYQVINMDHPDDSFHITMEQGSVTIDATCVEGNVVVAGNSQLIDNSGPNCTVTKSSLVEPGDVRLVRKILQNRQHTDPGTGIMTVYDDDDATIFLQSDLFEDVAATQAYRGQGADRRNRLI